MGVAKKRMHLGGDTSGLRFSNTEDSCQSISKSDWLSFQGGMLTDSTY